MNAASKMQTWLSAGLFPLKIYAFLAGVLLVIWHSRLPPNRTTSLRPDIDHRWELAARDFTAVANVVVPGYFVVATVLLLGGSYQLYSGARKAGYVSLAFALVALVLGFLLMPYLRAGAVEML